MSTIRISMAVLIVLSMALGALSASADDSKRITITESAPYYDEIVIPEKIKDGCPELGRQFSEATRKYLEKAGYSVSLVAEPTPGVDHLELKITNAISSGNAFVGHRKSVSILAQLIRDGEVVDTFTESRDSSGGFSGGFKGSCGVLHRCVNTLGSDLAKWLAKKMK